MKYLPETQWKVLDALQHRHEPLAVPELALTLQLDQSPVMAACTTLAAEGYISLQERAFDEYRPMVYGVILIVTILFLPEGLQGLPARIAPLLRRLRRGSGGTEGAE